jgi:2-amino-4-hydroxy-6-hydroxymethyldihydropteridine diphosphokinase
VFVGSAGNVMVVALGANLDGCLGTPVATLRDALMRLSAHGIEIVAVSSLYRTEPIGGGRQKPYFNAVALAVSRIPPARALRIMKRIEHDAGRRQRGRDQPRPLDLDIVAAGGRVIGWPRRIIGRSGRGDRHRCRGRVWLSVPHPEADRRGFVLVPLAEIAPHWHHPVRGMSAQRLLAALPRRRGDVQCIVDSSWRSWHKTGR